MDRLAEAREVVQVGLMNASNPAVLWSGGKDSQLLLAVVREFAPEIPVVFFRDDNWPDAQERLQFAYSEIKRLGLTVYAWKPVNRVLVRNGDKEAIFEQYPTGAGFINALVGVVEDDNWPRTKPGCVFDVLKDVMPAVESPFDVLFHGQREVDVHDFAGHVPCPPDGSGDERVKFYYPLRNLVDDEVWNETYAQGIPINRARYSAGSRRASNDEFDICTRCFSGDETVPVECPLKGDKILPLEAKKVLTGEGKTL